MGLNLDLAKNVEIAMSKNNTLVFLGITLALCFGFGFYFFASSKPQPASTSKSSDWEATVVLEEVEETYKEQSFVEQAGLDEIVSESTRQLEEETDTNRSEDFYIAEPEDVMQGEFLNQFMSDLTDEERTAIQLQSMQTSIEDRISNLAPGSISEEELQELYDDIDFLDENNVFLGEEAEQLKIYTRSMLEE